jgi:thiamine-monophosphate kinase
MRESEIIALIRERIAAAGDDAAVLPFRDTNLVLTTDMLHRRTDFPAGASPYVIGWRAVAVSLSDLAAMGARPLGVLLALGDPDLESGLVNGILHGAIACCASAGTALVGGDTDRHQELTLVSSAVGEAARPVRRRGARVGDAVCVTGDLGRTQAALRLYAAGDLAAADELFAFSPRVEWGLRLAPYATSMIDISDGLAHSLHLLAQESGVGFEIDEPLLPVSTTATQGIPRAELREAILFGGEDYELLFTVPKEAIAAIPPTVRFSVIGNVTEAGVRANGHALPDTGYEH